jgi:hypothetical protein
MARPKRRKKMREDQVVAWLGLAFAEVFLSLGWRYPRIGRLFSFSFVFSLSLSLLSLLG